MRPVLIIEQQQQDVDRVCRQRLEGYRRVINSVPAIAPSKLATRSIAVLV